jgi:hypothetical protein
MSVPKIDHLEFESEANQNEDASGGEESNLDNIDVIKETDENDDSSNINKSIKIVEILQEKAEEHNSKNPTQKVRISQLRAVFRKGARQHLEYLYIAPSRLLFSLARVNMYLRQKTGEVVKISNSKERKIIVELDISEGFVPNEKDIAQASDDIKRHEADFDFEDIDDLYLDNERITLDDYIN